ncbi:hypothetical protein LC55x_1808 [Lysobacter capsici]|nr:hypothetical protein LC55x_1808 [Lysobacter capsici]
MIYLLKMKMTTVAQIWRQPDGRWKATCNTHQAEKFQRSALIDTEQEARDRLWAYTRGGYRQPVLRIRRLLPLQAIRRS